MPKKRFLEERNGRRYYPITVTDGVFDKYGVDLEHRLSILEALCSALSSFAILPVTSLPSASSETMGKIYLVPISQGSSTMEIWITLENGGVYSWRSIGNTQLDLSGYATEEYVDSRHIALSESDYEQLAVYDDDKIYMTYEDEEE